MSSQAQTGATSLSNILRRRSRKEEENFFTTSLKTTFQFLSLLPFPIFCSTSDGGTEKFRSRKYRSKTRDAAGDLPFPQPNKCKRATSNVALCFHPGLMLAIAIEECGLHRRIALTAMGLVGTAPRFLMLGFMVPTALLSMWISNTATTAMMLPIMEAVLAELGEKDEQEHSKDKVSALETRYEWLFLTLFCRGRMTLSSLSTLVWRTSDRANWARAKTAIASTGM